jgi:hypothetical protein
VVTNLAFPALDERNSNFSLEMIKSGHARMIISNGRILWPESIDRSSCLCWCVGVCVCVCSYPKAATAK